MRISMSVMLIDTAINLLDEKGKTAPAGRG